MKFALAAAVLSAIVVAAPALSQIETAPPLPLDEPQSMRSMEAVCTGIGLDARSDPRWAQYPLRVEVIGTGGQFLGETQVTVTKDNESIVSVRCSGPWVLFRIEPGAYTIAAEVEGESRSMKVTVGGQRQARAVIRFPEKGGAVSPEHQPPK